MRTAGATCGSVPRPIGCIVSRTEVEARIHATYIEAWRQGKCVAQHERCFGRQQKVLDLNHYLEALERKPGALAGATALEQCRAQGKWPASYDQYWEVLRQRQGMLAVTRKRIFLDGGRHTVPPEGGKGKAACARVRRK